MLEQMLAEAAGVHEFREKLLDVAGNTQAVRDPSRSEGTKSKRGEEPQKRKKSKKTSKKGLKQKRERKRTGPENYFESGKNRSMLVLRKVAWHKKLLLGRLLPALWVRSSTAMRLPGRLL